MSEYFFKRIKLLEQFEMVFKMSKTNFIQKLSHKVDEDKSSFMEAFSGGNDYKGVVSVSGFNVRAKAKFGGASGGLYQAIGEINEISSEEIKVSVKIKLLPASFMVFIFGAIFISIPTYFSIKNNHIREDLTSILFMGILVFSMYYYFLRIIIRSGRKQFEKELFFIINN